eukprot:TRINITY_DN14760_c0_g1_i2.p1 TRINITY_DN14760_c0_g1~~TRINITY_DN14760_c0_g1_i2.p1  ORF type:complete len:590 (+),score=109.45 TRINITY_DN14760_c0_g1_i2:365-2134(+)
MTNCPAIDPGDDPSEAIAKNSRGAFVAQYPVLPSDPSGFHDLTDLFKSKCDNAVDSCGVQIPHDKMVASTNKLVVAYTCGESPVLKEVRHEVKGGEEVRLECEVKTVVKKTVHGVSPVSFRLGSHGFDVWPVGFTLAGHRYSGSISWKVRDFAALIPSNAATYVHKSDSGQNGNAEPDMDYFHSYKHSLYCVTRKKKGWDALRHYEILASGCVPYFIDIDKMPANTMVFFPKALVSKAMRLPGVNFLDDHNGSFNKHSSFSIDRSIFNATQYYDIAAQIQAHARRHLTSEAMATYILEALTASGGPKNPQKVLFISHCYPDFMGDSLWSGFKELEISGKVEKVDDIVPPKGVAQGDYWKHIYGDCPEGRKLALMTSVRTMKRKEYYSQAGGWGNHRVHNQFPDPATPYDEVAKKIQRKEYDVVVYATPTRTMAFADEVRKVYGVSEVALLHGGDDPSPLDLYNEHSKMGTVFAREIYDDNGRVNTKMCYSSPGIAESQGHDCCIMSEPPISIVWSSSFPPGETWTQCATEGGECSCTTAVRFGSASERRWSVYDMKQAGKSTVRCMNRMGSGPFPDPAIGKPKLCQCRQ